MICRPHNRQMREINQPHSGVEGEAPSGFASGGGDRPAPIIDAMCCVKDFFENTV